jgi:hypothetical protein
MDEIMQEDVEVFIHLSSPCFSRTDRVKKLMKEGFVIPFRDSVSLGYDFEIF